MKTETAEQPVEESPGRSAQAQHSPLPWKWCVNWRCPGKLKGAYIDSKTARVADVCSIGVSLDGEGSQDICEANAEFIVRACNAYPHAERLAEALKITAKICISPHIFPADSDEAEQIREALKQWEAAQ